MHAARSILVVVASALPLACMAQAPAASPATSPAVDPYRNEAVVVERSETTYRMHADGTGERDLHVIVRVQSDSAVQQFGVLTFGYAAANETPVIKFVRVHKSDGSTVETPVSDAIDMPADVSREAPLYSDLKEKHIPVRSLSPGDKLEYEVDTQINKPEAPGQFWGMDHFIAPGTTVALAEVLTLEFPSDKYVQVWSPNRKPTITDQNGEKTYSWNVPQLVTAPKASSDDSNRPATPKDPDEDDQGRKLPSVAWTTFHNWTEVGEWYRSLALKQADPTDALRARADELTANAKTPEEQIRAIFSFVSQHTRYVGIDFGIGRYRPHIAGEVLADQYGDCKDKDSLLEALLRAKGFSTAPALIGVGIAAVPDLPSPALFNHVITTVNLSDGQIWLDSTPMVAPYRYLGAAIRDQKALVVPANAAASLESTPANAPYPFMESFVADGTLDADGKLTAKMSALYRDDNEIYVRALAVSVAPSEWDKASQYISSVTGFGGTTSNTQFKNVADTAQPIGMNYDYARHPFGDWDDRRIVPLFPATEFTMLDSDTAAPDKDIQLGAPRMMTAVSHIHLPEGYRPNPPDPVHVKTDFATFDKTYRYDQGEIIAERDIQILKEKVPKADWQKYQKFTKDIGLSGENWIQLIPPAKQIVVNKPVQMPAPRNDQSGGTVSVQQLRLEAADKNAPAAEPTLKTRPAGAVHIPPVPASNGQPAPASSDESARASNDKSASVGGAPPPSSANESTPTSDESATELMAQAMQRLRDGNFGGARETLDQVREKNPNEENLWSMYGALDELIDRDYDRATEDFQKELDSHPDNKTVVRQLADAENRAHDPEGARKTVQQYLDRHPDDAEAAVYLYHLETLADNKQDALKTLEIAAKNNPDNRFLRAQMSYALVALDRMPEAAAAAKSALEGASDAYILNDAAYALGETGLYLAVAEDASRKSIKMLEEKSASFTTESANQGTFLMTSTLAAYWDTLGWILFKEGKFEDAQSYISPAWRVSLEPECGDHLGQIYEAEKKKKEAAKVYGLAETALKEGSDPDSRRHIEESLDRLEAEEVESEHDTGSQALQDLRTFKIDRPKDTSGWGTFRLEVTTAGVIESQQMSGEKPLDNVKLALAAMKFPEMLPPDSTAHLLLSAVIDCSMGTKCDVVLVPNGGLQTERQ
jgi:tetratricopeptide (TPR) repeat protein